MPLQVAGSPLAARLQAALDRQPGTAPYARLLQVALEACGWPEWDGVLVSRTAELASGADTSSATSADLMASVGGNSGSIEDAPSASALNHVGMSTVGPGPALHGAVLAVPRRAVEDLARALEHADEAAVGAARKLPPAIKSAGAAAAGDPDGLPAQLEIVVQLDRERWPAVGATATVLQLLAMPMLQSARQTLEKNELANNARPWQAGYC
ncbi:MAG: hypothetical protein JO247_24105, partial [Chloroflexi bacterium]|nr:hypothetical protein [Chloroflexota bacterium]